MEWTWLLKCDSCFAAGMRCRGRRGMGEVRKGPARDHINTSIIINTVIMPTWYYMVEL